MLEKPDLPDRNIIACLHHKLAAGTELPSGLNIVADGLDVNPASSHPATHHTIFNTVAMTLEKFIDLFDNLPWQYVGRK